MTISKYLTALALFAGAVAVSTPAKAATLKIGDPAPPLQESKWVQGEPVQSFDTNHVYLIDFWATWCGPCRTSIPHLNDIWQNYKAKGLIVIGQDCSEQNESEVPGFVEKMGNKMTYRVALDDKSTEPNGAMAMNWMKAAGLNAIPTAFIVDHAGKIAWIGHPMLLKQSDLDQILAGTFDENAYAKEFEKKQAEEQQLQALTTKARQAMQDKDWDTAESTLNQIENLLPETARFQVAPMRMQILINRNDLPGACKLAGILSDQSPTNAILQNELAWGLATAKGMDPQGLALAQELAERANKAANGKVPGILDTLARTQFMNGQTNEAIATEEQAVAIAPDEMKTYLQRFLADYQQGKLPMGNQ